MVWIQVEMLDQDYDVVLKWLWFEYFQFGGG